MSNHSRALGIFFKNFALLFATITILILAGEYTIRFAFRDITTTYDNRSYFAIKWKKENIRLNSTGFREREFDPANPSRLYRIAVIGDSFAFGQGIPEKDRVSNILEAELGKIRSGIEVLNFGVPGANTVDEIPILKYILAKTRPDFVLLQWFINDVEIPPGKITQKAEPSFLREIQARIRRSSALYFLLSVQWNRLREKTMRYESYPDAMYRRFGNPANPESMEAEKNFLEFVQLCKENNVPLGIVLFPQLVPAVGAAYPFSYLHERVLHWCAQEGISCIDLRNTYSPYMSDLKECKKLWANRFDSHPSQLANRLAAEKVFNGFGKIWLTGRGQ